MGRGVKVNQRRVPLPARVSSGDEAPVLIQGRAGHDPIGRRREAGAPDAQRALAPSLRPERLVKQRADPAATTRTQERLAPAHERDRAHRPTGLDAEGDLRADAGDPRVMPVGAVAVLDGSFSEGDGLTYAWAVEPEGATLLDSASPFATLIAEALEWWSVTR